MLLLWIGITFSFSLATAVWLVFSETDAFNPVKKLIKQSIRTTETIFNQLVKEYMPGDPLYFRELKNYLNTVLLRSGIKRVLPWLGLGHLIIIMGLGFMSTSWFFKELGKVALAYGVAGVLCIFSILLFMAAVNKQSLRKMYLNFLSVYTGFYDVERNEINALARTADYVEEPLKSILKRWTTLYKTSDISMDDCLEGILVEIGDKEFRKFIKFTKVNVKYGGDYRKALVKLKEQGEKLQSVYAMKASTAVVGTFIIILMIMLNLILVNAAIKDPALVYSLKQTIRGQLLLGGNAAGIIISIFMIFNINKD